ncbi:hypothetical protein D9M68_784870 [compost metagenome]
MTAAEFGAARVVVAVVVMEAPVVACIAAVIPAVETVIATVVAAIEAVITAVIPAFNAVIAAVVAPFDVLDRLHDDANVGVPVGAPVVRLGKGRQRTKAKRGGH